jgi:hypothetical protein
MASVIREVLIDATPQQVWDVVGDFPTGPIEMAPGYVVANEFEGPDERVVTFADGSVVRERHIATDEQARRIVWAWVGDAVRPAHDSCSMQVFEHGDRGSRLVWIHDVLPDELAVPLAAAMDGGLPVIKRTLEAS